MKMHLKKAAQALALVLTAPLATLYLVTRSQEVFTATGQGLALIPGKAGSYLRVAYLSMTLDSCCQNGCVEFGSYFSHPEASLEEGFYIGAYSIIGKAKFGRNVTIGSQVSILSGKKQHGYEKLDKPIQEQGGSFTQVSIGENCWIGNGAIVMADLGCQCVVGAGSVVTKGHDDYCVIAGNPARIIRKLGGQ